MLAESNNVIAERRTSALFFSSLVAPRLIDANTLIRIQQRVTGVLHSAGEIILLVGDKLSLSPSLSVLVCVCVSLECRVCGVCSNACDTWPRLPPSDCSPTIYLPTLAHPQRKQHDGREGFPSILKRFAAPKNKS